MSKQTFIKNVKTNNIMIVDNLESKILKYLQNTTNIENAATFYQLASFINIPNFSKEIICYVYRCFTMIAETKSYLTLDFNFLARILSTSQLNITSELEIFNSAEVWLRYNIVERSKFAKQLLFTVRLPLLSDNALDSVLLKESSFRNNEDCLVMMNNILKDKSFYKNSMNFSSTTRYCNQNMFNILTCDIWGDLCSPKLIRYDISNKRLKMVKDFPKLNLVQNYSRAVFLNGDLYIICYIEQYPNCRMSVQKFTSHSNRWEVAAEYSNDYIDNFCVCVFMGKLYIIGGTSFIPYSMQVHRNCFEFNPVNNNIQEVKPMHDFRRNFACTVFEGQIVVSGGYFEAGRTVEVYDHVADKWSYMPEMIKHRRYHDLVAIKNKLFAFGGVKNSCEVYDNCCKKFSLLKSPPNLFQSNYNSLNDSISAISMGNKIVIFDLGTRIVASYDINKEQWSEELIEMDMNVNLYDCVKLPQF